MFDSVLDRGNIPQTRFGTGAVLSVVFHIAVLGVALYLSTRPPAEKKEENEVKFFAAPPPPPPPPPPAGGGAQPKVEKKVEKKVVKKPDTIIQPKEIPKEKPVEAEPEPEKKDDTPAAEGGVVGGVEGGVVGGTVGGTVGGVIGGQIGGTLGGTGTTLETLPFGEGMQRPVQDPSNRGVTYTREATEAHVEGLALVKCIITTEGTLKNCKIIKPLPHLAEAILEAVSTWKFSPVMYQGRAVNCEYVIQVRLKPPK